MPASNLRFGSFELQPRERRLLLNGAAVAMGARAFDLLLALAARPGQLRTKTELLEEVWPGMVVEEANLSVQMSALRKVLGDALIATIPGRGYRFTGTLAEDSAEPPATPLVRRTNLPAASRIEFGSQQPLIAARNFAAAHALRRRITGGRPFSVRPPEESAIAAARKLARDDAAFDEAWNAVLRVP